jgi:hypothetical protein
MPLTESLPALSTVFFKCSLCLKPFPLRYSLSCSSMLRRSFASGSVEINVFKLPFRSSLRERSSSTHVLEFAAAITKKCASIDCVSVAGCPFWTAALRRLPCNRMAANHFWSRLMAIAGVIIFGIAIEMSDRTPTGAQCWRANSKLAHPGLSSSSCKIRCAHHLLRRLTARFGTRSLAGASGFAV